MPHTFTALYVHIVFSTSGRRSLIPDPIRGSLHAYIGGIMRNVGATAIAVGGTADHVHLLVEMKPSLSVADLVRLAKCNSSSWLAEKSGGWFAWQRGYAAFSVSRSLLPSVVRYVNNQEKHHRRRGGEEEWNAFLKRHGILPPA
jgi:putative transposase